MYFKENSTKLQSSLKQTKIIGLENTVGEVSFERVTFQFKTLAEVCREKIEPDQVVAASELDFIAADCGKTVRTDQIHWMPSARFLLLRFNPEVDFF